MKPHKPWRDYGRYGTVGIEFVASMLLGLYGGRWLDQRYGGGKGIITLVGFVVGTYAGFRQLFRAGQEMNRAAERAEREAKAERQLALGPDSRKTGSDDLDDEHDNSAKNDD